MEAKVTTRRSDIDWLRIIAIFFVFIYHSTRLFNMEDWVVKNPTWYPWVEFWNRFAAEFMMPFILVISGASLFYAIGKGGFGKFLKDKVLRLFVPWIFQVLTLITIQDYLGSMAHGEFSGSYWQFLGSYFFANINVEGQHLWYLWLLFIFSLVTYPLLRWLKGGGKKALDWLGNLCAIPGFVYALALPSILLLVLINPKSMIINFAQAGWPSIIYLWLLLSGFLIFSSEKLQAGIVRMRWVSLLLAVGSMIPYLIVTDFRQPFPEFGTTGYLAFAFLRPFCSWCCILAFLGFGMKHLTFTSPRLGYANEAVLPFYIFHQTALVFTGYYVVQWPMPDWLKWPVVLVISFCLIMACYEFVVRRVNVMRVLFGLKWQRK